MNITAEMIQGEIDRMAGNARKEKRHLRYAEVERLLNMIDNFEDGADFNLPPDVIEPKLRGLMREYFAKENQESFLPLLPSEDVN